MNAAQRPSSQAGRRLAVQVDAVMRASRALVGIAAGSIAEVDEQVTPPQLRILVMIATRGPLNLAAVAAGLGVNPSNASRACDRLLKAGLLDRRESAVDRRNVTLSLTEAGHGVVDTVTRHRRTAIAAVLTRMPAGDRDPLVAALDSFATAADEPSDPDALTLLWPST